MPLLSNELIKKQICLFEELNCDILVPKTGTFTEPLHSVCRKSVLQMLEAYLKEKRNCAVREFIKTIDARYMELDESDDIRNVFSNINFQSDIRAVEKILRREKE
jgi:molybdopterin-guanine dinucleotide biosynthesis protein A